MNGLQTIKTTTTFINQNFSLPNAIVLKQYLITMRYIFIIIVVKLLFYYSDACTATLITEININSIKIIKKNSKNHIHFYYKSVQFPLISIDCAFCIDTNKIKNDEKKIIKLVVYFDTKDFQSIFLLHESTFLLCWTWYYWLMEFFFIFSSAIDSVCICSDRCCKFVIFCSQWAHIHCCSYAF